MSSHIGISSKEVRICAAEYRTSPYLHAYTRQKEFISKLYFRFFPPEIGFKPLPALWPSFERQAQIFVSICFLTKLSVF